MADLATIYAFVSVMVGIFYFSNTFKDTDKGLNFLFKVIGYFFFWVILWLSGADWVFIAWGLMITVIPFFFFFYLFWLGLTFDQFLKIKSGRASKDDFEEG